MPGRRRAMMGGRQPCAVHPIGLAGFASPRTTVPPSQLAGCRACTLAPRRRQGHAGVPSSMVGPVEDLKLRLSQPVARA